MTLTRRQWVLLGGLTLLWSLNWPTMKFALREVSPHSRCTFAPSR